MQSGSRTTEPVFVDGTGRRRRLFVMAGTAGAVVLVLAVVVMLAGFTGVGPRYLPSLPVSDGRPAGMNPSTPSGSAMRSASPLPAPVAARVAVGAAPSATAGRTTAGATPTAGGAVPTASTTAKNSHRTVPTQTPTSHPTRRK